MGFTPPGIPELDRSRANETQELPVDDRVWTGDLALPAECRGLVALGAPIGSEEFIQQFCRQRLSTHQEFLREIPELPDAQCAWVLLLYCASSRCVHTLRTLPPSSVASFAGEHDGAMWTCLRQLIGCQGSDDEQRLDRARSIMGLPARMGGLGLRSAARMAPAAYWASWADALPTIQLRQPGAAAELLHRFTQGAGSCACIDSAKQCRQGLVEAGYADCPEWPPLLGGANSQRPKEDAIDPRELGNG